MKKGVFTREEDNDIFMKRKKEKYLNYLRLTGKDISSNES